MAYSLRLASTIYFRATELGTMSKSGNSVEFIESYEQCRRLLATAELIRGAQICHSFVSLYCEYLAGL